MGKASIHSATQTAVHLTRKQRGANDSTESRALPAGTRGVRTQLLFRAMWFAVNGLLILSLVFATYATVWEYSTRRYLQGFSDAIVPAIAPSDEKIEAILNWMSHGPARQLSVPNGFLHDRDPTDTLNYHALLQVCGTATNAFLNLADVEHMEVRRLLLLDTHELTKHVVAEVLVDDRWIIVDPAFRVILRSADGKTLTREELGDPATFAKATQRIPGYDPSYNFDRTAHIRVARLGYAGMPLQRILDRVSPGWDGSRMMTLFAERESYAAMIFAILLLVFLLLMRISIRWYGEKRLGIRTVRIREGFSRVYANFIKASR